MVSYGIHSWHHVLMHKRDDGDGDKLELLESVSSNAVQRKLSHDGGNDESDEKLLLWKQLIDLGIPGM